jgi:hypothetical protein
MPPLSSPNNASPVTHYFLLLGLIQVTIVFSPLLFSSTLQYTKDPILIFGLFFLVAPSNANMFN